MTFFNAGQKLVKLTSGLWKQKRLCLESEYSDLSDALIFFPLKYLLSITVIESWLLSNQRPGLNTGDRCKITPNSTLSFCTRLTRPLSYQFTLLARSESLLAGYPLPSKKVCSVISTLIFNIHEAAIIIPPLAKIKIHRTKISEMGEKSESCTVAMDTVIMLC